MKNLFSFPFTSKNLFIVFICLTWHEHSQELFSLTIYTVGSEVTLFIFLIQIIVCPLSIVEYVGDNFLLYISTGLLHQWRAFHP